MAADPSPDRAAPAVTRAIRVLDLLAEARGEPIALSDIARALGIAKSSTSNLCTALEEGGLIQRTDRGYRLGRRTVELGGAYLSSFDQVREFYRICSESTILSRELVQIAVLDGTDVLYLARHEGRAPLRVTAGIGDRYPASLTAVGNALLAMLDDGEVARRFADPVTRPALTDASITSIDGLLDKVRATRARGYSIDDGEVFPSVTGVAVTIPPRDAGDAPLALGVSMIKVASSDAHRAAVVTEIQAAARLLSNPMVIHGGPNS